MASLRIRTPPEHRIIDCVADALASAHIEAGARLCVALSGGVDSVVVLRALAELKPRIGFTLLAAHVHHGLSPNADAWQLFCQRLCLEIGADLQCFRVTVDCDDRGGIEAAARRVRHAALNAVSADWLVLGHHQDDQAETMLFRLLRGAGVRGAGAMSAVEPARNGLLGRLRPLLDVRRCEILAWAHATAVDWVEDESNRDPRFTRNYLRHSVFPQLEAVFPAAVPTLARAAENFREAEVLLGEFAQIDRSCCGGDDLSLLAVLRLSDARVRNLLRAEVVRIGADAPSRARLEEAVRQLRASDGRPLHLSLGELACCVYRDRVWIERIDVAPLQPLVWKGDTALCWGEGEVRLESVTGGGVSASMLEDAAQVLLTTRWEGLRMRAGPGRPRHSFRKLCQEAGIPAWMRSRLPVLQVDDEVAWIAGIGVAAEFACGPGEAGLRPVWRP